MKKRYQVSEEFKEECKANIGQYEKKAKIHVIEDNTDITHSDNLMDFKIEDNCYVNDKFIGNTVAKKITVDVINPDNEINLENKEISVQTEMKFKEDTTSEAENINIKGTIPVKFKEFVVKGNSKQETSDAMPSPEYPSPIQNVEGDVNVTVANKNIANSDWAERFVEVVNDNSKARIEDVDGRRCLMFHCSAGYQNEEAYFFKRIFKENTKYVIEYDIKPTQQASNVDIFCKDGTKYGNINGSSLTVNSWNKSKYTTATSKTVDYIRVGYYTGTCYIDLDTMQITEGTEANDYVENKQQTVTFPLAQGQKLMLGDYLADDGIHHKRKQRELDGTESWNLTARDNYYAFYLNYQTIEMVNKPNFKICNYFPYTNSPFNNAPINTLCENTGITMLIFKVDFCTTIEKWENWLAIKKQAGTPVIVEYELAEEEIEPYTEEQQEAYNQLKQLIAYEEETNVYSTNEVSPVFTVTADGSEEVPFGNFIIEKPDTEELKEKTSFTGYDYMIKFNVAYKNRVTYPIALSDYFVDLCNQVGLEAGNVDFVNADYMILGNPFTNNEDCRTVLSNIAQLAGGFARIGRDNKVYIISLSKNYNDVLEEIDGNNYFDDFSKNNQWGEVNSVVLRISGTEGENTVIQDEESIAQNGLTEIVIEDNYFLISQAEREKVITPLWDSLKGLKYLPCKTDYYGYPYLDAGDLIKIKDTKDNSNTTYLFNHTFTYNGAYSGTIETEAMTKTQTAYKNILNNKTKFLQVERKIDKINGQIEDVIEEQTDFSNKITKTTQDIDSINDEISRIYDFEKEVQGTNEIILQDCLPTTILELRIKPEKVKGDILYPANDLYPSPTTYPHKAGDGVTVVFAGRSRVLEGDTIYPSQDRYPSQDLIPIGDSSTKKFQFYFGEPLRIFNDVSDEFRILFNEETGICEAKVIRRIDYNNGVYTIYDIPKEEHIGEKIMELFKGTNYIYLEEYTDWNIYARYVFNNELNDKYALRVETNSSIRRTADEINLTVSEKVGKDEIITAINLSPEKAKIQSTALELEGYTTINGGFTIDEEGNASIANDTVQINKDGIQMADGASLVGGKGLITNLQFFGNVTHAYGALNTEGYYDSLGFEVDELTAGACVPTVCTITPDIPENFTIEKAYVTIKHYPTKFYYNDGYGWGYSRKLKLYQRSSYNMYREYDVFGGALMPSNYGSEITDAFGEESFTPSVPSNTSQQIDTVTSIDLSNYLNSEQNRQTDFIIRSSDTAPAYTGDQVNGTDYVNCAYKTGMVMAVLNVFGYLKLESNEEE